jgi:hypothetical protein
MRTSGIRPPFEGLSQTSGQVSHVLLTRSPLGLLQCCHWLDLVRLACVKHAASVRPEPGSNSPSKSRASPHAAAPFDRDASHSSGISRPRGTGTIGWCEHHPDIDGAFRFTRPRPGPGPEAVARTRSLVLSSVFKERPPLAAHARQGASVPSGGPAAATRAVRGRGVNLTIDLGAVNLTAPFPGEFFPRHRGDAHASPGP